MNDIRKNLLTSLMNQGSLLPVMPAYGFSSHFYLIAIFFVIFDLDAVFILAWAISFRELGIAGYLGILVFIGILLVVLVYEIGIKALDFGPQGKKILKFKNRLLK